MTFKILLLKGGKFLYYTVKLDIYFLYRTKTATIVDKYRYNLFI